MIVKIYLTVYFTFTFDLIIIDCKFSLHLSRELNKMKKTTVIKMFGSATKVGKALGITRMAVSDWGENIPELRVYQVERLVSVAEENNTPLELLRIGKNGRVVRLAPKGEGYRELVRLNKESTNGELKADFKQAATAQ